MRKFHPALSGFSLPELLVAIALLAVLLTVGHGLSEAVRERLAVSGCIANLRQIGVGIQAYANDHHGYLPDNREDADGKETRWQSRLDDYVHPPFSQLAKVPKSPFVCPAAPRPLKGSLFYALNQELRIFGTNKQPLRQSEMKTPGAYVLLADASGQGWITTGRAEKMIEANGLTQRHKGKPNFLYGDGHAAPFTRPLLGYADTPDPFYQHLWFAR